MKPKIVGCKDIKLLLVQHFKEIAKGTKTQ